MPKTTDEPQEPTPDDIMDALFNLLDDVMGCPEVIRHGPHNPFNPAKTAWLAYDMLHAALEEVEIETIVDSLDIPKPNNNGTVH